MEGFHRFFFPAPVRIKSEAPADLRMAVEGKAVEGMVVGGMAVSAVAVSERGPKALDRAGAERDSELSHASEPHNA